jgi:plasmid stabilization system protein ParE
VAAVRRYAETGRGDVLPVFGELDRLRVGNYRVFIGRVEGEVRVVGIFHRRVAYARHILRAAIERLKKFRE